MRALFWSAEIFSYECHSTLNKRIEKELIIYFKGISKKTIEVLFPGFLKRIDDDKYCILAQHYGYYFGISGLPNTDWQLWYCLIIGRLNQQKENVPDFLLYFLQIYVSVMKVLG